MSQLKINEEVLKLLFSTLTKIKKNKNRFTKTEKKQLEHFDHTRTHIHTDTQTNTHTHGRSLFHSPLLELFRQGQKQN